MTQISLERLENTLSGILSDRYNKQIKVKAVEENEKSSKSGNGGCNVAGSRGRVSA